MIEVRHQIAQIRVYNSMICVVDVENSEEDNII